MQSAADVLWEAGALSQRLGLVQTDATTSSPAAKANLSTFESLVRFIPYEAVEKVVTSGTGGYDRTLCQAACLFVDISGYSKLADTQEMTGGGPEVLSSVLNGFLDKQVRVTRKSRASTPAAPKRAHVSDRFCA
jgi:hypothetical protein